jgi:arylsulfatase A-like enzyme
VVEALRRRGSLDRTLLVVLADHGELLGEHEEFGHGLSTFQPTMRVPLLIRLPGVIEPSGVAAPVSTAGVFATVLDVLGIAKPPSPPVVTSLVPTLDGKPGGQPVLSERLAGEGGAGRKHPLLRNTVRLRAYRSGAWKLVETSAGEWFLYDLENDPDEDRDVATGNPAVVDRLRSELSAWRDALGMPELGAIAAGGRNDLADIDPVAKERLKALGYVE